MNLEILLLNPMYELYINEFWVKTLNSNASSICPAAENKISTSGNKMCNCKVGYVFIPNTTDC